jgi:hypothetical protein
VLQGRRRGAGHEDEMSCHGANNGYHDHFVPACGITYISKRSRYLEWWAIKGSQGSQESRVLTVQGTYQPARRRAAA